MAKGCSASSTQITNILQYLKIMLQLWLQHSASIMDTALPQKFPFILDRNLAKANCTGNPMYYA